MFIKYKRAYFVSVAYALRPSDFFYSFNLFIWAKAGLSRENRVENIKITRVTKNIYVRVRIYVLDIYDL